MARVLVRPMMEGTITNTAIVTSNQTDSNPSNNEATDTLTVVSVCSQLESLIATVNDFITSGELPEPDGQFLIEFLTCPTLHSIKDFIAEVNRYIQDGVLEPEQGSELIDAAEFIKGPCGNSARTTGERHRVAGKGACHVLPGRRQPELC